MMDGIPVTQKQEPLVKQRLSHTEKIGKGLFMKKRRYHYIIRFYKIVGDDIILLTVKARYGKEFMRKENKNENRV